MALDGLANPKAVQEIALLGREQKVKGSSQRAKARSMRSAWGTMHVGELVRWTEAGPSHPSSSEAGPTASESFGEVVNFERSAFGTHVVEVVLHISTDGKAWQPTRTRARIPAETLLSSLPYLMGGPRKLVCRGWEA